MSLKSTVLLSVFLFALLSIFLLVQHELQVGHISTASIKHLLLQQGSEGKGPTKSLRTNRQDTPLAFASSSHSVFGLPDRKFTDPSQPAEEEEGVDDDDDDSVKKHSSKKTNIHNEKLVDEEKKDSIIMQEVVKAVITTTTAEGSSKDGGGSEGDKDNEKKIDIAGETMKNNIKQSKKTSLSIFTILSI